MSTNLTSPFYTACSVGDEETVKKLLANMIVHEITQLEGNGETALHAASKNGHEPVVKLLLARHCSRSVRDSSGKTAYEVASTPTIAILLNRPYETKRFENETMECEWVSDNFDSIWKNLVNVGRLFELDGVPEEEIQARQRCVIDWVRERLKDNIDKRDLVVHLLEESFRTGSAEALLRAYTEETDFYRFLNRELARVPNDDSEIQPILHPVLIIARTFFRSAYYGRYTSNYSGVLYRAVKYSEEELAKYQERIGKGPFKTKTCWSASKLRMEAENAVSEHNVMLILTCRDKRSRRTLDLAPISAYPREQEVLIVPLTYMQVIRIEHSSSSKYDVHIEYWDW